MKQRTIQPADRSPHIWKIVRYHAITLAALGLTVAGGFALAWPFVAPSSPWRWSLQSREALSQATVHAEIRSVDERGVLLAPHGSRPISLISPRLAAMNLPPTAGRTVSVIAAWPMAPAHRSRRMRVHLLWQLEKVPQFKYESQEIRLGETPQSIRFSLPLSVNRVYRLGVQFPDISDSVQILSIGSPSLSLADRLTLAAQQITSGERIVNHSVNFIVGPQILGHPFNFYLIAMIAFSLGLYGLINHLCHRRIVRSRMAVIVLAVWFAADAHATWNLSRQARAEIIALRTRSRPEQITLIDGREIAWCYEQLLTRTPQGSRYTVLSDDPFTPAHRLDYLLAPLRVRCNRVESAGYIVVIHARGIEWDGQGQHIRWKDGPWFSAEKIAELSSDVYLLKKVMP